MTPPATQAELLAAQKKLYSNPAWSSPGFTSVAVELIIELNRSQARVQEARELFLEPARIDPAYRAKRNAWLEATK